MAGIQSASPDSNKPLARRALAWCAGSATLSLAAAAAFWRWRGPEAAQQYLAGYLVELSLSVDNVLVLALIFSRFAVPPALQRRALSWGVWGAIALRGALLLAGLAAIRRFSFLLVLFGAFLVWAGVRMFRARHRGAARDPAGLPVVAFLRRRLPLSDRFHGNRFVARENGRRVGTLLLLVLIAVEAADLVFAVDSLPAVLAVTRSAEVAIASNFFAVLGLRSLYFAVGHALERFPALKAGLALVLILVGAKMLAERWVAVPTAATLGAVAVILAGSLLAGRRPA